MIVEIDGKKVETTKDHDFMIAVAKRLVEIGEHKTLAEAILHLAYLGAHNTPRFLPPPFRD